jgi:hypothetical protein
MISNNSSVIINNSRDEDEVEDNDHGPSVKRSQASPTSSTTSSSPSSRASFSPTPPTYVINHPPHPTGGMSKKSHHNHHKTKINMRSYKTSLSTLESDSEISDLNQSSAASTLSSTGNSSSTSGIANSITYFPSLDEEDVVTSTPVEAPPHSLRFFVNPASGRVDIKSSPSSNKLSSAASFRISTITASNHHRGYDTRSLDRRKLRQKSSMLVTIKDNLDYKAPTYCTLRRGSTADVVVNQDHRVSSKVEAVNISSLTSNVLDAANFSTAAADDSNKVEQQHHRVRKLVKSVDEQETLHSSENIIIANLLEASNKNNDSVSNTNIDEYTSDDDDLSHAEELSYSSQVTSTSVESLTSSTNLSPNVQSVLPTGWHRHPGPLFHHPVQPSLGPLDEIHDDDEEDLEDGHDHYSSVVKKEAAAASNKRPRFSSVLRSSRILRRHTTYYHSKQFDSLPPQASMSVTSSTSRPKPHVHSWHRRHRQSTNTKHQVSIHNLFCHHIVFFFVCDHAAIMVHPGAPRVTRVFWNWRSPTLECLYVVVVKMATLSSRPKNAIYDYIRY